MGDGQGEQFFERFKKTRPRSKEKEIMFNWIKNIIRKIKNRIEMNRQIKELKKKDPFIYK